MSGSSLTLSKTIMLLLGITIQHPELHSRVYTYHEIKKLNQKQNFVLWPWFGLNLLRNLQPGIFALSLLIIFDQTEWNDLSVNLQPAPSIYHPVVMFLFNLISLILTLWHFANLQPAHPALHQFCRPEIRQRWSHLDIRTMYQNI